MKFNSINTLIKKNLSNIIIGIVLMILIFDASARAWVIQQVIATGIFNAEIKKEKPSGFSEQTSFLFSDSTGKVINTSQLKGKTLFINFWASWCPPCRGEMPSLNQLYLKMKNDSSIVFLFINEDDNPQKGKDFLTHSPFAFPFYTQAGDLPEDIFSGTLPTTVVIDKEGRIAMKHQGMAGYDNPKFISELKNLP